MSRLDFSPWESVEQKAHCLFSLGRPFPSTTPPLNSLGCTGHDAAGTCMRAMLRRNLAERRAGGQEEVPCSKSRSTEH